MNRLLALAWLVIVGTNVGEYYSEGAPYNGAVILGGAVYFLFVFRREFLHLLCFGDYLLILAILVVPTLLMLGSDLSFDRGLYTSHVATAFCFVVASVLLLRRELDRTLTIAAFAIVAVGVALNLYELFVQNNVWSIAPGRSAGLYINPNISGEALVGWGLIFLMSRRTRLSIADLILTGLVLVGVFATFSRAGILASLVLLPAAILMRAERRQISRILIGGVAVALASFAFAYVVVNNLDLSEDATARILSLTESGGVGDYREDRGMAAEAALDIAMENPMLGAGVGTIYALPEGPHNMFLAMMVDYGIVGLLIYLFMIVRLIQSAIRADLTESGMVLLVVAWLVIFGFASHNLLQNTVTIPLLGFAVSRAYQIHCSRKALRVESGRSWT